MDLAQAPAVRFSGAEPDVEDRRGLDIQADLAGKQHPPVDAGKGAAWDNYTSPPWVKA